MLDTFVRHGKHITARRETKDMFCVYLTPVQDLLLPKSDIVKGAPEELHGLLQSKLPQGK